MKREEFWNIDNVKSFRNFDVDNGEVSLSDSEYVDYLNEIYGTVEVCGQTFEQGDLFKDADPIAFDCQKGDYESQLQSELEKQLDKEDSDDIEFIDGDEWDLDDEEEEDEE